MGIVHQGSGNGDALALAAGELIGLVMGPGLQSHGFQLFHGPPGPFFVAYTGIDQRQRYVVEGGNAGEEIEILEDETDVFVANRGQFVVAQIGYFFAAQFV